ncbi:MAG: bifunctional DNA-formamidopyrimidine glycosylase/DNA-(apurinic or apyrimidinic site) lyase [Bacillota bacterium]
MPELPEVETIRRTLEQRVAGLVITDVNLITPKIIKSPSPQSFIKGITGKKIKKLGRRGKYLMMHLSGNKTLLIHLRMTGRLVYTPPDTHPARHTHAVFTLDNGYSLHFTDVRQFGRMILADTDRVNTLPGLRDLGLEPLGKEFTRDFFKKGLKGRRAKIKSLLLDQTFIAGLGNIYADEALHRARINPEKIASTLSPRETARLYLAIKEVLAEGIANRGTSFRDYVDGMGKTGSNQETLRVYNREGKPCLNCTKPIVRIKLGGRSSYYCPTCQK